MSISRATFLHFPFFQKEALINAMINHATGQRTLPSKSNKKPMRRDDGMMQSQLSFGQKPKCMSQIKWLREMVMEKLGRLLILYCLLDKTLTSLGPCVKINPNLYWLVGRLHIIAYRGTEKPTRFCLPALLAGFKKWDFPEYRYERTAFIWPTRDDLLEYEEALYLDVEMDNLPGDTTKSDNLASETESKTPVEISNDGEEFEGSVSKSIQGARHVTTLYKECIERKWKALLARKNTGKGKTAMRAPGLERFEAGKWYDIWSSSAVISTYFRLCVHKDGTQSCYCLRHSERTPQRTFYRRRSSGTNILAKRKKSRLV